MTGGTHAFDAHCPEALELAALLDGELSENRAQQLRGHLPECRRCRERYQRLDGAAAALPHALGEPKDDAFVGQVMQRIAQSERNARPRRTGMLWGAGLTLAASAVAVIAVTLGGTPSPPQGEYLARGGAAPPSSVDDRTPAVRVFEGRRSEEALKTAATIDANKGFRFQVSNPERDRQLMLFGVDAKGEVHWFYPGWVDPDAPPSSVPLAAQASPLELPEGVTPEDVPAGGFEVVALFLDSTTDVVTVEALLGRHGLPGLLNALKRTQPGAQMQRLPLQHAP